MVIGEINETTEPLKRQIQVYHESQLGKPYTAICHFDSGSSVDLINANLEILRNIKMEKYKGSLKLSGAFGSNGEILGTITLGIKILEVPCRPCLADWSKSGLAILAQIKPFDTPLLEHNRNFK